MHDSTPPLADNPLWQFAQATWYKPGVADTLLRLQDEHGLNVNLLLLMLWLGERQVAINAGQLLQLQEAIRPLDTDILQPLRQVRRRLKTSPGLPDAIYQQAKALELALEQQQLACLYLASVDFLPSTNATSCRFDNLINCASARLPAAAALLDELAHGSLGRPA